jgi:hypothetical protein
LSVYLVAASAASKYNWCVKLYGNYSPRTGVWYTEVKVYFNYARASCKQRGIWVAHQFSVGMGLGLGLQTGHYGSFYSAVNFDRTDVPYFTAADTRGINRRYPVR